MVAVHAAHSPSSTSADLLVPHVLQGNVQIDREVEHASRDLGASFFTPALDLDAMVWPRTAAGPAFDLPIAAIIDFLVQLGERLDLDRNDYLRQALQASVRINPLGPRILENCYRDMAGMFRREILETEIDLGLGGRAVIDGWDERVLRGRASRLRAFPCRLVHVLAGNSPMVAAMSIMRAALTKGVHLLKLPSNDLFTATAILRTMADMDPGHPLTRSFSAAYWRGGDASVESAIYRAQYFDKIVVWGGESAVRHVSKYIGPGLELIAFDPKVSFSMVGREAFESEQTLRDAAQRGAADVLSFNQDACNASRYQFVEGDVDQVDRYAEALSDALAIDVRYGSGQRPAVPQEIRNEVEILREMEPIYRVFGEYEGRGLVIRFGR